MVYALPIYFIDSVKYLRKAGAIFKSDVLMHMPIFYNPHIKVNFKQNCLDKGIWEIEDIFNALGIPMKVNKFEGFITSKRIFSNMEHSV